MKGETNKRTSKGGPFTVSDPVDVKKCFNCLHWLPNGGLLGYGYCRVNQMGYRKPNQNCKTKFVSKCL